MATYLRDDTGLIEYRDVTVMDGKAHDHVAGPLTPTGEVVQLKGWPDTEARIYVQESGGLGEWLIPDDAVMAGIDSRTMRAYTCTAAELLAV